MTEKSFLDTKSDVDFVCDVLVDALQQRRSDLITDLFDLYNKVRERANVASTDPLTGLGNISINTTDKIDEWGESWKQYNFELNSSYLNTPDIISFNTPPPQSGDTVINFSTDKISS